MARLERVKTGGNGFMARWMYYDETWRRCYEGRFLGWVSITRLGLSSGWHFWRTSVTGVVEA